MASHWDRILETHDSSQIEKIFFREGGEWNLRVMFANGSIYEYFQVPLRAFAVLAGAESVGSAFHAIKGELVSRRVV